MIVIPESVSAALASFPLAFDAVRTALMEAASGAIVFPAVIAHGSAPSNRLSIKSAAGPDIAGVKIGSYWPGNSERGLPRHNSTILLVDQETGRIEAVIEATVLNAYRTAAADAVAAQALARADSRVLALFGSGHQAEFECAALCDILPIDEVLVVARSADKAADMVDRLARRGIEARPSAARDACLVADIVVTATSAREALFDAAWIRSGTHVASMGSDAAGKQELPPDLLRIASCFCDLPAQSVTLGEFQHVAADVAAGKLPLTAIGDVLAGRARGRTSDGQITVFDSSGIALQDLHVGHAVLRRARERLRKD